MHIMAMQAFVIKRTSCSSSELYLLSFSAHGGASRTVLGPLPPLSHKTLKGPTTSTHMKDQFSERALLIAFWLSTEFFGQKL